MLHSSYQMSHAEGLLQECWLRCVFAIDASEGAKAPLLVSDSYLGCVYDDGGGESQFRMELWKTGESQKFIETDPTSDLGR